MRKEEIAEAVEGLLRVEDLASGFRVCAGTVYWWAKRPHFPQPIRIGGRMRRWCPDEVEDYVRQRNVAWFIPWVS